MPFIRPETIARLADAMTAQTIIAPFCHGRSGHPVGFGLNFKSELMGLTGDKGGRSLFQLHPPTLIPTDDVGTITDIDGLLGLTKP
jgi:molybdenum cofactor cytidylyltransferase